MTQWLRQSVTVQPLKSWCFLHKWPEWICCFAVSCTASANPQHHKYSCLRCVCHWLYNVQAHCMRKGEMQQGLAKWSLPNFQAPKGLKKMVPLTLLTDVDEWGGSGRGFMIYSATEQKLWLLPVKELSAEAKRDDLCPLQTLRAPSCSFCFREPTVSLGGNNFLKSANFVFIDIFRSKPCLHIRHLNQLPPFAV